MSSYIELPITNTSVELLIKMFEFTVTIEDFEQYLGTIDDIFIYREFVSKYFSSKLVFRSDVLLKRDVFQQQCIKKQHDLLQEALDL